MVRGFVGAAAIALALVGPAATEAAGAVYRDPPSYEGRKKAPKTEPAPLPDPVPLAPLGLGPHLVVDDAGTAHIVWAEGGDSDGLADRVIYCRLKRGARTCDARHTLRAGPESPYNTDYGGPRIVRVGDQLVAFSKRYPEVVQKPDGGSSSTVWAWTSGDGGTTWSDPAIVGKYDLGDMTVIGPSDSPQILNFGFDAFCGICITAYRSGEYSGTSGNLATRSNDSYYAQIELVNGLPIVSWVNLDGTTHLRRWTGQGSVIDPATWTAPVSLPNADETDLAGGPSGLSLLTAPRDTGRFQVRTVGAGGFGAPVPVTPAKESSSIFGTLEQDAGGRLLAAWSERNEFKKIDGLWLRAAGATPGGGQPRFAPAQRSIRGIANGQIDLAATQDGGGFVAFNHTAGCCGHGEIMAGPFGNQAPNGKQGLGAIPGGGASGTTCQQVKFGSFTADAAAGCFLNGTGENSHLVVTGGEINLHGLRIIPVGNTKITLDPRALRIDTSGDVRVVVSNALVGELTIWRGEIHRDLSAVRPGTNLFEFPIGSYATNILGFDVGADIGVRLEDDGVHIPLALKLPPVFGGFSGEAELISTRDRGLVIDSLHIHIGPLPLGPLIINAIDIRYSAGEDLWSGSGSITLPAAGTLDIDPVEFAQGRFRRAAMSYTPAKPIPIGPFVYLLRIGGGFTVEPIEIEASARIGGGAAFNGTAPVNVDGKFVMSFPPGRADFTMTGALSLFVVQIADGFFNFQSDGYAAFGGHAGGSFGPLSINAETGGFVDGTTGQFGARLDGDVGLCIDIPLWGTECLSAGSRVAVSSKGFAACVGASLPDPPVGDIEAGLSFPWSDWDPLMLFNPAYAALKIATHIHPGCNVDDYTIPNPRPAPRAAQAGGQSFAIPAGLPTAGIKVEGQGGRPSFTATGPGGVTVGTTTASSAGVVFNAGGPTTSYLLLRKPRGGTWTITPNEGSPAITSVQLARGFKPLKVRASLGGRGGKRSIEYRLSNRGHEQRAVFLERGKFGTRVIGAVTKARGTLRFRPADVRGRSRTVLVQIQRDGFVKSEQRVGKFRAPPLKRPGKVRKLRVSRRGNALIVRWRGVRDAQRYTITVRGRKGTSLGRLAGRKARKVKFVRVRRDERIRVSAYAVSKKLRRGPTARKNVPAAKR